jgi:antitoxin VapB
MRRWVRNATRLEPWVMVGNDCRDAGAEHRYGGGDGAGLQASASRIEKSVYNLDMALSIKDPEADRLARELAARTGETLTEAVVVALRERLARESGRTRTVPMREELAAIRRRCAALPVVDNRSADEILGYDDRGLPA